MKNLRTGIVVSFVALFVAFFGISCAPKAMALRDHAQTQQTYARGAVAADHVIASNAGAQMLAKGGNAVDAAVAASFTLSVVRPYSCGIGGGGFMVIHLPKDPTHGLVSTAINYRETSYVEGDYFERNGLDSVRGGAAVAIPGTVAGLLYALEAYGTLDRATVLAPAIEAAVGGFVVDEHYEQMAAGLIKQVFSSESSKERFPLVWEKYLRQGQFQVGDLIQNQEQRRVLELITRYGRDGFYAGEVGESIIDAIRRTGGEMTLDDLQGYEPVEYPPMIGEVNGYRLIGMPPPSSGGVTMIQAMQIMEAAGYDFGSKMDSHEDIHVIAESLKHAFADRSAYLADPEFVELPIFAMLDPANIALHAGLITDEIHPILYYGTQGLIPEDGGTSHLSVVDQWGGAVACTETINLSFGSMVGVDAFGFVLNDQMDDFTRVANVPNAFGLVQSDRNLPEVGKRPLSSMSPTIVLDGDGVLFAVAGASGGPKIITGTMQVLLGAMAGMDAGSAVGAERIHHQWLPDVLMAEGGLYQRFAEEGRRDWNVIKQVGAVGNVQLILRDPDGKGWQAACDPRKGGRPARID